MGSALIKNLQKPISADIGKYIKDSFVCTEDTKDKSNKQVCCPEENIKKSNTLPSPSKDECTIQSGESGSCVVYSQCRPLLEMISNLRQPIPPQVPSLLQGSILCGFEKIKEIVLIDLELSEDVIDLCLGHFVSPGHQSVGEHLGVDLALLVVSLEGLNDQVIGVVAVSGHLVLEHFDHVVVGAGTGDLAKETVELSLGHEHTDIVEGSTEVVFVQGAVLVDVHQLEAVLVHLELLLGEAPLILALAHLALLCETCESTPRYCYLEPTPHCGNLGIQEDRRALPM